jgi:hypothetical protein
LREPPERVRGAAVLLDLGGLLPQGAQLAGFEAADQELRVRYRHQEGSGEVRCATLKEGSLDDTASINLKSDFLWDHPEIAPRL